MSAPVSIIPWKRVGPIPREPQRVVFLAKGKNIVAIDTMKAPDTALEGADWWAEAPQFDENGLTRRDMNAVVDSLEKKPLTDEGYAMLVRLREALEAL